MNSKIRLTSIEIETIVKTICDLDSDANIYLYGSRTDPLKKGGDIDLLIISDTLSFNDKINLLIALKEKLGEQKIDLSIKTANAFEADPFFSSDSIKKGLVLLGSTSSIKS